MLATRVNPSTIRGAPMTTHVPHTSRGRRALPTFAARESLEGLPSRRPPAPSSVPSSLQCEQVGLDRYVVRRGARTLGFIDVVGAVFVVLAGPRHSHAVEFAQTLVFEDALGALNGDDPPADRNPQQVGHTPDRKDDHSNEEEHYGS